MNLDDIIDLEDVDTTNSDPNPFDDTPIAEPVIDEPDQSDDTDEPDIIEPDDSAVAYFEYLKSSGVLDVPDDFEFDGTANGIEEALASTRQNLETKAYQEIWQNLPEDFKPLLDYAIKGGTSLKDYLEVFAPKPIENYDLEDPISQKIILTEYYKMMNPSANDEKIERLVTRREQLGDLQEEAQDALDYIKEMQEERRKNFLIEEDARQKEQQKQIEQSNENLRKTIKESEGLDQLRKNRIETLFFTPRSEVSEFNQKINAIFTNPSHLVQLGDVIADYDPRIGFTFDRLKKKIKTESTRKFSDLIQSKIDTKSQVRGTVRSTADDFDLEK